MSKHPNTINETQSPEEHSTIELELDQKESLRALQSIIQDVHKSLVENGLISRDIVCHFKQTLSSTTVLETPINSLSDSKEFLKNTQIWQEIISGKFDHYDLLTYLPAEVATSLTKCNALDLMFCNLKNLSPAAAQVLARDSRTSLQFISMNAISTEIAQALATFKGGLFFENLTTITNDSAKNLAAFKGRGLWLNGLKEISTESAKKLAQCKASRLCLGDLTEISTEVAEQLARYKGCLGLFKLISMTEQAAQHFSKYKGYLILPCTFTYSPEVKRLLKTGKKQIEFH